MDQFDPNGNMDPKSGARPQNRVHLKPTLMMNYSIDSQELPLPCLAMSLI